MASESTRKAFGEWEEGTVEASLFGPIFGIKANHERYKKKNNECPRTKCCDAICGDEDCKQEYVHVWGDEKAPHFRIYKPDDTCPHGMSLEHAEAQEIIKCKLNEGKCIRICVECKGGCGHMWTHDIQLKEGEECRTEVRFKHNNKNHGMRSADIGIVPKGASAGTTPTTIIEVLHSSKTDEFARPKNCRWFEVFASAVIDGTKDNLGNIWLTCQRQRTQTCQKCTMKLHCRNVFRKVEDLKCKVFSEMYCEYDYLECEREEQRRETDEFYVKNLCALCDNVTKPNNKLCAGCFCLCKNDHGLKQCLQNAEQVMRTRWKDAQQKKRHQDKLRWRLYQAQRAEREAWEEKWAEKLRVAEAAKAKAEAERRAERAKEDAEIRAAEAKAEAIRAKKEAERQAIRAKKEAERQAKAEIAKAKAEAREMSRQAARRSKREKDLKRKAKTKDELVSRKNRKSKLAKLRASQVQYDIEYARELREEGIRESESHTEQEIEHAVRKQWLGLRPIGPCIPPNNHYTKIDYAIKCCQREEDNGVDPVIY